MVSTLVALQRATMRAQVSFVTPTVPNLLRMGNIALPVFARKRKNPYFPLFEPFKQAGVFNKQIIEYARWQSYHSVPTTELEWSQPPTYGVMIASREN